jgi:hypothetical protein
VSEEVCGDETSRGEVVRVDNGMGDPLDAGTVSKVILAAARATLVAACLGILLTDATPSAMPRLLSRVREVEVEVEVEDRQTTKKIPSNCDKAARLLLHCYRDLRCLTVRRRCPHCEAGRCCQAAPPADGTAAAT